HAAQGAALEQERRPALLGPLVERAHVRAQVAERVEPLLGAALREVRDYAVAVAATEAQTPLRYERVSLCDEPGRHPEARRFGTGGRDDEQREQTRAEDPERCLVH